MKAHRGFFVSLEGIEGSGKSTVAAALGMRLASPSREIALTQEPGGDPVALGIRAILLDSDNEISEIAELLLFEAARAQHVDTVILPALRRGGVVICDRFTDSTLAYQGHARGIDLDTIRYLNDIATRGLAPDITILLDLGAEDGLARQVGRDRISMEKRAFHEAVRKGYLETARHESERFVVIDASMDLDEVVERSLKAIEVSMVGGR